MKFQSTFLKLCLCPSSRMKTFCILGHKSIENFLPAHGNRKIMQLMRLTCRNTSTTSNGDQFSLFKLKMFEVIPTKQTQIGQPRVQRKQQKYSQQPHLPFSAAYLIHPGGVKIAIRHQIFPTELIKSMISCVDKFPKMSGSKKKFFSFHQLFFF